ncbi:MAG: Rad3-related DNA helicase, partial [Myxococcota bacterium]
DRRIASRRYGRVILYALPPARRAQGPARSVLSATEQFFKHGL